MGFDLKHDGFEFFEGEVTIENEFFSINGADVGSSCSCIECGVQCLDCIFFHSYLRICQGKGVYGILY